MAYLVDGNNVMGQRVGWHRDKAGARRRLLDEVAGFVRGARVTVSVVFDGAPDDHFPDGSRYRGVQVFYAARNSNADERIKRMVDASRERRTLIVVTSDRALADYVRQCGARVIRAGDFRRRLDDAQSESKADAAHRSDGGKKVPAENLDHWMRYFGVESEDESDE
ncbi:MAG TPA: NYN domain-containing protein [Pyrinomonadaceae bacterium]|jgi:predicted RNA-binding protein with PIN domain|nr:NYN domain-containing protein [Pyrinomonadaceae bacterium]